MSPTPHPFRTEGSIARRHRVRPGRLARMAAAAALACAALATAPSGAQVGFSGGAPVWLADGNEFLTREAWAAFCAATPTALCVERHFWGLGGTWAGAVPTALDDVFVGAGQVVRVQAFDSALRGPIAGPAAARDVQVLGRLELFDRLEAASGSFAELAFGAGGVLQTGGLAQVGRLFVEAGQRARFEGGGGTTRLQAWEGPTLATDVGAGHRLELAGHASGQDSVDALVGQGAVLALTGHWSGDRWRANAPAGTVQPITGRVAQSGTLVAREIDLGALAFDNTGTVRVTAGGTLVQRGALQGGRYEGEAGSTMSFIDAAGMAAGGAIDSQGRVQMRLDRAQSTAALAGDLRAAQVDFQGRHALGGALVAGQVTVIGTPLSAGSLLRLAGPGVDVQRLQLGDGLATAALEVTGLGARLGDVTLHTGRISVLEGAQATLQSLAHAGGSFNLLEVGGELGVAGRFDWGAQPGALAGYGRLVLQGPSTLDTRGGGVVISGPLALVNEGTLQLTGDLREGPFTGGSFGVFNAAGARLEVTDGSVLGRRHANDGTWLQTAATTGLRTVEALDNRGLLRVEGGSLQINAGGVHSGRFEAADGSRITLRGDNRFEATIVTLGAVDVSAGAVGIGGGGAYTARSGTVFNAGTLGIEAGGRFDTEARPSSDGLFVRAGLDNAGTLRLVDSRLDAAAAAVINSGRLELAGALYAELEAGGLVNTGHLDLGVFNESRLTVNGSFEHAGTAYSEGRLVLRGASVFQPGSSFQNLGRIAVEGGELQLLGSVTGGGWITQSGGRTVLGAAGAPATLVAGIVGIEAGGFETEGQLSGFLVTLGAGSTWTAVGPTWLDGARVDTQGQVTVPTGSELVITGLDYRQTDGHTVVEGRLAVPTLWIDGGLLSGSGVIDGDVVVGAGGTWAPGSSPGTVTVNGNVGIAGGTLRLEFGADGRSDRIVASGTLEVDGTIDIDIAGNTVLFGDSLSWAEAASTRVNAVVVVPGLDPDLVGQLGGDGGTVLFTDPGALPMPDGPEVLVAAGSSMFTDDDRAPWTLQVEGRAANTSGFRLETAQLAVASGGSFLNRGLVQAGEVFNDGQLVVRPGAQFVALGSVTQRASWLNEGTVHVHGALVSDGGRFDNAVGALLQAGSVLWAGGELDNRGRLDAGQLQLLAGQVRVAAGAELVAQRLELGPDGVLVNDGSLQVGADGARNEGLLHLQAGDLVAGGTVQQDGGRLQIDAGRRLQVTGASFEQGAGLTQLAGRLEADQALLHGGRVEGDGVIAADVVLTGGAELAPGPGLATLTVEGGLRVQGGGFAIDLGAGGLSDRIVVTGDVVFDPGATAGVVFRLEPGYAPGDGDRFGWLLGGGTVGGASGLAWRIEAPDGLGGFLLWGDAGGLYQPGGAGLRVVFGGDSLAFAAAPVPEPATLVLMLGGVGLLLWRRRAVAADRLAA